jgi:4-diphosphocytidyl-2-C-methyl-D-erythritol kinase
LITLTAPAKINLTLEVLGRRDDGYHEVLTVMQAISLADTLRFERADRLSFSSDSEEWSAEKSLVSKAALLLQRSAQIGIGAEIHVSKHIPFSAGLGGDSSDAAAVLTGLDRLWGLAHSKGALEALARELGSDVAFFIHRGTALASGRGEIVRPLNDIPRRWIVVVLPLGPPMQAKTAAMYSRLKTQHYTDGIITARLVGALESGAFDDGMLFNTFENVAFDMHAGLETTRAHLIKMGAKAVHLAGSGPAMYVMLQSRLEAEEMAGRIAGQGLRPFVAQTVAQCDGESI